MHLARWIEVVVLGWLVLELTDSPFLVALAGALRWMPLLAFGPVTGLLADRIDRKTLVQAGQVGSIAVTLAVLGLLLAGALTPFLIFLASFVVGLFAANDMPARRGLLADLVGQERLVGALTLDVVSMNVAGIVGGFAGGTLLALFDPAGAYLVMLAIYVGGFHCLLKADVPRREHGVPGLSPLRGLLEGARFAMGSPVILATLLVTVGMNFLVFPYKQLLPVFARDELGVGPQELGVLAAADGAGALISTFVLASLSSVRWKGAVYLGGSLLMAGGLLLFGFSHQYLLSLASLVVLGMGMSGFQTMQAGIILLATPREMRGRLVGILSMAIGCFPLGMLALGAFASVIGPLDAVQITAVVQLALVAATLAWAPALRRF